MSLGVVHRRSHGRFPPSTVGGYERGERTITLYRFHELAGIYGIPADRLLRTILERLGSQANLGVTIDLQKLPAVQGDEGRALNDLVAAIRAQREGYLGDTISLRAGDLEIVAHETGKPPDKVLEALRPALRSE